ncbi:hypothetical protein HPB50_026986 [Hyalomma asiaticum]|uniref:Uncharacterized protein n=1 Tax=Hyalomma asiaticum TaxID=266040 RepID=A0ACB7S9P4_HYAAI|nr:hypothetical protein HPB50_026986 [Hyalomma asiaticum]
MASTKRRGTPLIITEATLRTFEERTSREREEGGRESREAGACRFRCRDGRVPCSAERDDGVRPPPSPSACLKPEPNSQPIGWRSHAFLTESTTTTAGPPPRTHAHTRRGGGTKRGPTGDGAPDVLHPPPLFPPLIPNLFSGVPHKSGFLKSGSGPSTGGNAPDEARQQVAIQTSPPPSKTHRFDSSARNTKHVVGG